MSGYCEVVVNRPILRHRIITTESAPPEDKQAGGPATVNPLEVTFSYAIPKELRQQVALGQLVEVPFRSGTLQGVIVGLSDTPPPDVDLHPIASILDPTPALTPTQIELARWLSARYHAHLSSCVWLCLPPGVRRLPQTVAEAVSDKEPPPDLNARALAMLLYLRGREDPTPASELEAGPLKTLSDIELVRTRQRLAPPRAGPQINRTVELIATPEEIAAVLPTLGRASKQADVLLYLATSEDPLPALDEVLTGVGCTKSPVDALVKRGWVKVTPKRALVTTTLSGPAIEAALADLEQAPAPRTALSSVCDHPGPVETDQVDASSATLAKLEAKGYVRRWTEPATVALTLEPSEVPDVVVELRGTAKHAAVLDLLGREEGKVWIGWVYAQTDATLDTLRVLAEAELIALDEARRWRDPLADQAFVLEHPPRLTPEQESVWNVVKQGIRESGNQGIGQMRALRTTARSQVQSRTGANHPTIQSSNLPTYLLHGVTGSGKTEVYLRAVGEALRQGQGAIVLVPEIALAAQTVRRVVARFPGKVAVWHSNLSLGERFDTWQRVRDGELPVVVGARSALFAPVPKLGVIVVDEEHEPAYKGGRSPRYHAREVALQLGQLTGASVILGSATPDVVTFRRTERGELTRLTLPKRVLAHRQHLALQAGAAKTRISAPVAQPINKDFDELRTLPLPQVEIVDLREELKAGNRTIFSRSLQAAMREARGRDLYSLP
jgi:primosomal protein N' (replication factor Y)